MISSGIINFYHSHSQFATFSIETSFQEVDSNGPYDSYIADDTNVFCII